MSGYNFNFSGMFGGGFTNNLNKNNFDFSAYAPKQEEKVTDPIDIVSNNTPEAKVEVLEGAADVAITKQPEVKYSPVVTNAISALAPTTPDLTAAPADPITDAIQSVQPKPLDLGMDFSVTPETAPVSGLTSNIPVPSSTPATGGFMDVGAGQAGVSSNVSTDIGVEKAYDLLDGSLESNNQIEDINNYLSSQQFTDYMSEYDSNLSALGDYKKAEGATTSLLNQVGLPKALGVEGKYGGYKNYTYNGETNQYELTADTERSALDVAAPEVIKAAAIATFTANIGSAIGASNSVIGVSGGNTAIANGIGQGIAHGASAALQGGNTEDILKSAALGGLDGYVEGLDLLTSDAEYMLGLADSGAELASHAETMNMVMDGVDLVTAIDEKDVLGALDAGLSLGGMPSTKEIVSNTLLGTFDDSTFVNRHSDVLAEVGIKATVDIAQGADAKEVIQNATNNTIKELVLTEENVSGVISDFAGDSEFVANNLDAITKTAIEASGAVLDGENRDKIIETAALTYIKEGGQLTPNTEGGANILDKAEDWYHENIENPLEEFWQEIEPEREVIENALGGAVKFVDEKVVQPVVNTVKTIVKEADQVVRDLPTTKEDWEGLEDDAKQLASDVATPIRETGRAIEAGYDVAEDFVKEEVAPVINQVGRDVREAVAPVTEVVRETGRTIRDSLPDSPETPNIPDLPSTPDNQFTVTADPEITDERRGFYYDDSGLVSNPFLRGGEQQRIKSLTEMIQMEQEKSARQAAILADEEERKLRYKTVYGVNPNVQVKYNG